MEIFFMRQDALDKLKASLPNIYQKYFTEETNQWIYDFMRDNNISEPFIKYKDLADFSLSSLDNTNKGEIELQNCKIMYSNLKFLNLSQASDERLWAGLMHTVFYNYTRSRWGYDVAEPSENIEKDYKAIKSRYFFVGGTRSGFYRNTLAKYWWVGKSTYSPENPKNRFEKLDIIGANDLTSKISDIFYNYTFVSNQEILDAIIMSLKYFRVENIELSVKRNIRPAMQALNAWGGYVVLDCLSKEEISEKVIMFIKDTFKVKNTITTHEVKDLSDEEEHIEEENDSSTTIFNNQCIINDAIEKTIKLKSKIAVKDVLNNNLKTFIVDFKYKPTLGWLDKHVGEKVKLDNCEYIILDIE